MFIDSRSGGYVHTSSSDAHQSGDTTFARSPQRDQYEQWHLPPLTAANDNAKLPRVVGLAGAAGSGKSTVSEYLIDQFGYTRVKFADPLKNMCRAIGMTEAMIEGDEKELPVDWLQGRSPRYAMQRLGTDWGRDLMGPDLWVGLWTKAANDVLRAGGRVVADDVRFDNEAETIRGLGGLVYQLTGRGGLPGQHSSEAGVDVDVVIHNTGTIHDLYREMRERLYE